VGVHYHALLGRPLLVRQYFRQRCTQLYGAVVSDQYISSELFQAAYSRPLNAASAGPSLEAVPMPICSGDQLVPSKLDQNMRSSPDTPFQAAYSRPLNAASAGPSLEAVPMPICSGDQKLLGVIVGVTGELLGVIVGVTGELLGVIVGVTGELLGVIVGVTGELLGVIVLSIVVVDATGVLVNVLVVVDIAGEIICGVSVGKLSFN
jgi:hypothetical protein